MAATMGAESVAPTTLARHAAHGDAQCPFWHAHGANAIRCEGCVEGAETITHFTRKADKAKHMTVYCCRAYGKCPVYRAVMEKYAGGDEA